MPTNSSRPRKPPAPPARWWTRAATGRIAQILVGDTLEALQKSSAAWRAQFSLPVIGVAGSNGKTTVKEMTAAILAQAGATLATRGSLNNHIGVPLTLHRARVRAPLRGHRDRHEPPGRGRGARASSRGPTVGLITNAGAEHLEGFGSIEGAARAEGEMVAGLEPAHTAVLNADDEFLPLWRGMTRARVVTFGQRRCGGLHRAPTCAPRSAPTAS